MVAHPKLNELISKIDLLFSKYESCKMQGKIRPDIVTFINSLGAKHNFQFTVGIYLESLVARNEIDNKVKEIIREHNILSESSITAYGTFGMINSALSSRINRLKSQTNDLRDDIQRIRNTNT